MVLGIGVGMGFAKFMITRVLEVILIGIPWDYTALFFFNKKSERFNVILVEKPNLPLHKL